MISHERQISEVTFREGADGLGYISSPGLRKPDVERARAFDRRSDVALMGGHGLMGSHGKGSNG